MELLTSPKSTYLLDAGLDVLHEQSNEWVSEIAFWRDETAFFYFLVAKKTLDPLTESAKKSIEKIEDELIKITGSELDELQKAVEQHEKLLSRLLESKNESEESYRYKHKLLTLKVEEFENHFKSLKKEVFAMAEMIDKNKKSK